MAAVMLRPLLEALRHAPDWRDAKRQAEALVTRICESRPNEQDRRSAFAWALMTLAGKPPEPPEAP